MTLDEVVRQHVGVSFAAGGRVVEIRCCGQWRDAAEHAEHQTEALRLWLRDQREVVAVDLLTEQMDGDLLVGAGRSIGNEGDDVGLSSARPNEVAWWAADGVLAFLIGDTQ